MAKPASPVSGTGSHDTDSIAASGGASDAQPRQERVDLEPSTSTSTPSASLSTNPASPSSAASP